MRLCLLTLAPLLNEAAAVRRSSSHNTAARYLRPENVSRDDSTYTTTAGSLSDGDGINFDKANLKNLRLFDNIDFSIESHFNGFQLELGQESNDVELELIVKDTAGTDGSNSIIDEDNSGANNGDVGVSTNSQFNNNRYCGTTFENAVDTHCTTPISCQFQRCPTDMTCYILSDDDLNLCDASSIEDTEEVKSSEPSEGWSEMPVKSPSASPSWSPMAFRNNPTSSPKETASETPSIGSTLNPITATPTSARPTNRPSNSSSQNSILAGKNPTTQPTAVTSELRESSTSMPSQSASNSLTQIVSKAPTLTPSQSMTNLTNTASPTPEPTVKVTPTPTFLQQTPKPTYSSKIHESLIADIPKLKYVLLTTHGIISEEAVGSVEIGVNTFFSAQLATYYDNFVGLAINAVDVQAVSREIKVKKENGDKNQIRRHLSEVIGTSVVFEGDLEFDGIMPMKSELTEVFIAIGEDYNEYLVSNITSSGNPELDDVVIVLVESSSVETFTPSSAPSIWLESFARNPDKIFGSETTQPREAETSIIIVSICGVAALTMFLFVFATRNRVSVANDGSEEDIMDHSKSRKITQHVISDEIDVESAQSSYTKSSHDSQNNTRTSYGNNNEAESTISSVADHNDPKTTAMKGHVEVINGSRSPNDAVAKWKNTPDHSQKSIAEINNFGIRAFEDVVPKTWALTSSEKILPPRFPLGISSVLSACRKEESESDESSAGHDGGFPVPNGSFPTAMQIHVDSSEFQTLANFCREDAINKYLNLSPDCSPVSVYSAMGSRCDGSYIGTIDNSQPEGSDDESLNSHISTVSESTGSASSISQVQSQDTKDSSTSLKQFISDLVWLEKKIKNHNDAVNDSEEVDLPLNESDIEGDDSYSYQCDSFSPRSNSSLEEDSTTVSSRQASEQMSIVCRDCYVPPGEFKINIVSTVDGPIIDNVEQKFIGHLSKGDLIIALDDSDTRSLSAEDVLTMIASRSSLERKLTVLRFGSSAKMS